MIKNPLLLINFLFLFGAVIISCKKGNENNPDVATVLANGLVKEFVTNANIDTNYTFKLQNWNYEKSHYMLNIDAQLHSPVSKCEAQVNFIAYISKSGRIYDITMNNRNDCAKEIEVYGSAMRAFCFLYTKNNFTLAKYITGFNEGEEGVNVPNNVQTKEGTKTLKVDKNFNLTLAEKVYSLMTKDPSKTPSLGDYAVYLDPDYKVKLYQQANGGFGPRESEIEFFDYSTNGLNGTVTWVSDLIIPAGYSRWDLREHVQEMVGLYKMHHISGNVLNSDRDIVHIDFKFKLIPRDLQKRPPTFEEITNFDKLSSDVVLSDEAKNELSSK